VTETIREDPAETEAPESVAHLSEPELESDLIHTLEESLTVSQTMCFVIDHETTVCTSIHTYI